MFLYKDVPGAMEVVNSTYDVSKSAETVIFILQISHSEKKVCNYDKHVVE